MRIKCPDCGATAKITNTREITALYHELYVTCTQCGARTLHAVEYVRHVHERNLVDALTEAVNKLNPAERSAVLSNLAQ